MRLERLLCSAALIHSMGVVLLEALFTLKLHNQTIQPLAHLQLCLLLGRCSFSLRISFSMTLERSISVLRASTSAARPSALRHLHAQLLPSAAQVARAR